jgi:hypothetical protein
LEILKVSGKFSERSWRLRDKAALTVTLRGPDGETTTIKGPYARKLDRVAVGDLVDITYTEALAVSGEPPGK